MVERTESVGSAIVSAGDALRDEFDVVGMLTRLVRQCVNLHGISTCAVMFARSADELQLVASSSEDARVLQLFEVQRQEGPCLDTCRTGIAGIHRIDRESTVTMWPRFAEAALEAGVRSVMVVPLRLGAENIGTLTLFSTTEQVLSDGDAAVAQALADLAAISIIQHRALDRGMRINNQLTKALRSRIAIEQAKGVIAERAKIEPDEAFVRLRRYARENNLPLRDVAEAALTGNLDPAAWTVAPETRRASRQKDGSVMGFKGERGRDGSAGHVAKSRGNSEGHLPPA